MRALRIAALVALAGALSACAGIPTSGPIQQGPVVAGPAAGQLVRVIPRSPTTGMTPEDLVRGFQEATASPDSAYSVAREYLTAQANTTWRPGAGVTISDGTPLAFTRKGGSVIVEGNLAGTIDPVGEYSVAAPGTPLLATYGVQRVDGEWRISSLPQGLVLTRGDIDRGYRAFDLFFFNHDFSVLTPAPVVVPLSDNGVATVLVRGILEGPTPWLAPSVRTAFPQGTRLNLQSVPVVDGVAEVDLSSEVLTAEETARQALSAQLAWTLRQLPGITDVRITVQGQPLAVSGAGTPQPVDSWATYDPDGLPNSALGHAVDKKGFVQIGPDGTLSLTGKVRPALVLPAFSIDSTRFAAVSADRRSLYDGAVSADMVGVRRYAGTSLSRPSFDRDGGVWVVDRGRGLVLVQGATATVVPVEGWPDGVKDSSIRAAAVSRDGTRIALLVRRGSFVEPMVARIERSADSVHVSAPRRVEALVTDALDLAWADASTIAVLGAANASALEVLEFGVGTSQVRRTSAPQGATEIAAGPGSRPVLVAAGGVLYQQVGSTWVRLGSATDPVYPG